MPSSSAYIDETISESWHGRITMRTGTTHAHAQDEAVKYALRIITPV